MLGLAIVLLAFGTDVRGAVLPEGLASAPPWPLPEQLHESLAGRLADLPPPQPVHTNAETYVRSLSPAVMPAVFAETSGLIARSNIYRGTAPYVRVARVGAGLGEAIPAAIAAMDPPYPLAGLIIDLRFASGDDSAAARDAAAHLARAAKSGFAQAQGAASASADSRTAAALVLLVNEGTTGAAEEFARAVRAGARPSILIGTNTAGRGAVYEVVGLPGGRAVSVRVANATEAGLVPDVTVSTSPWDEASYFETEFVRFQNGRPVETGIAQRLNEAELVRRQRGIPHPLPAVEDLGPVDGEPTEGAASAGLRIVQDPVLARAIDLVDALASRHRKASEEK